MKVVPKTKKRVIVLSETYIPKISYVTEYTNVV